MSAPVAALWRCVGALALGAALWACGEAEPAPPAPFAELEGTAYTRYRGRFTPTEAHTLDDGVEVHRFAVTDDGPGCLRGGPYLVSVRDTGSPDLLVYLQGGGACWSDFCLALSEPVEGIPPFDVLNPDEPLNPMADWNVAYLPYCDGGLFAGDRAWDDDGDGVVDRDYRGLRNLTAALDLAQARFPDARRVVFAGSSGGAYGTIIGLPLVRMAWPAADLRVINDSGVGVAWGDEPQRLTDLVDELGAQALVPASCPDCLADGHLLRLVRWQLERDPGLKIAAVSSLQDQVIAEWFLRIGGEAFEAALRAQTGPLAADFPKRYRRFLADGDAHTALLGGIRGFIGDDVPEAVERIVSVGGLGVTVIAEQPLGDWLRAFLAGDDAGWPDRVAR